jgi:hypothetical protein
MQSPERKKPYTPPPRATISLLTVTTFMISWPIGIWTRQLEQHEKRLETWTNNSSLILRLMTVKRYKRAYLELLSSLLAGLQPFSLVGRVGQRRCYLKQ